jgi:hypothetical protein
LIQQITPSFFSARFEHLDLLAQPRECCGSGVQRDREILDAQFPIGFFVFALFSGSGVRGEKARCII